MFTRIVFVLLAISYSQVVADPNDDLLQEALKDLTQITEDAKLRIETVGEVIRVGDLTIQEFWQRFYYDASSSKDSNINTLGATGANLINQAEEHNLPESVIACINNISSTGISTIIEAFGVFMNELGQNEAICHNTLEGFDTTVNLTITSLDDQFHENAINMAVCEDLTCFEEILTNAANQYEALVLSLSNVPESVVDTLKGYENISLENLGVFKRAATSEQNLGREEMYKCFPSLVL